MADRPRTSSDERPDPDLLLDRYNLRDLAPTTEAAVSSDSSRPARGRLRIYLGMAAGVGKTYDMLNEGRRRKQRGTDVVIGWVDTHHRPLTEQQIGDLEVIPRQRIEYRGVILEEMDLDAVLARRPAVALVDELAHTNAPGARNAKRYQDVEELLAAGITVITTVNIQHLESMNDVVETVTAVRQRETIPDRILDGADEVEMVDISPEALRARLRHGNVYPPERATMALERYFSLSNLTALRELALQRVSELTQRKLDTLMRVEGATGAPVLAPVVNDCVLVAFDGRAQARRLFHEGWRLAHALRAPLLAVNVTPPQPSGIAPKDPQLEETLRLAVDLGAEVIQQPQTPDADIAEVIAQAVNERRVSLVIVGAPAERRGWLPARPSVVGRLLRLNLNASILIAPRTPEE